MSHEYLNPLSSKPFALTHSGTGVGQGFRYNILPPMHFFMLILFPTNQTNLPSPSPLAHRQAQERQGHVAPAPPIEDEVRRSPAFHPRRNRSHRRKSPSDR